MRAVLLAGAACIVAHAASAAILTVGPGKTYATVSAAIAASANGDVIQVQSGTYTNDTATITTSITIESVGGRSSMVATVPVPNTKGILVIGTATTSPIVTIDGFDFSGATTPSGTNAAGVMYQSGFLTLTNDSFHNNQDGLRGAPISVGSVLVDHCEFFSNGINDSLTHNVYIGIMPSFTIQNSYIHDAIGGHNIKSRALNTTVRNNRIFDNSNQTSYSVDIPQSGNATIDSNIIQQSAVNANPAMIAYGEESGVTQNPGTTFAVSNNTFVNDMTGSPIGVWNLSATATAALTNNSFWGLTSGQYAGGTGANTQSGDIALGIRPTLDTTTLPYNTVYTAPLTLSVIAGRLAVISGKFALLAPGSRGGGGVPAGALVDETGAAIVDETGAAIIAN
jgi:hypothetical protein